MKTRYPVTTVPPFDRGADHVTDAVTAPPGTPDVARPMRGADGADAGAIVVDSPPYADQPIALTARIAKR